MGAFLRARRAKLRPEDVGMPTYGARRVPGLRREEIALLAGVSSTYYTRLEQGQQVNASEGVLEALAKALALTPAERTHLFNLARAHKPADTPPGEHACARPGARRLIESMTDIPALIMGRQTEVLAWNRLGHRLLAPHRPFESPDRLEIRPNLTRMLFEDPYTRSLYPQWADEAGRATASLRVVAGRFGDDRGLQDFVAELEQQSAEFRRLWREHPIDNCISGLKYFQHPAVGELELDFEVLATMDDSGQRMLMYNARPGSPSAAALIELDALAEDRLLGSGERAVS